MAGRLPEQRVARPLAHMRWVDVSFLHWPYDPGMLQPLLPPGLELDTWDGAGWVGLVPFVMAGVRPTGLPPLPGLSRFCEFNVRTYVRGPDGRDGLLFLTLEANQPLALTARAAVGIRYAWSRMVVSRRGADVGYASRRRRPRHEAARLRLIVSAGAPIPAGERTALDDWLTGRWRAYSHARGRLWEIPVEHEPWPLHRAAAALSDPRLIEACALPRPDSEAIVHYAPGVGVRLGMPRPVG